MVAGEGSLFHLENNGYGTCAIAYKRTGFLTIGGQGERFDEDGKLVKRIPGVTEDQRQRQADAVFAIKDGLSASDFDAASVSQSQFGVGRYMNRSAA